MVAKIDHGHQREGVGKAISWGETVFIICLALDVKERHRGSEMHWSGGEIREIVLHAMEISFMTTRLHRNHHKEDLVVT